MNDRYRLGVIVMIWVIFAILTITLLIVQQNDANFILVAILAFAAIIGTSELAKVSSSAEANEVQVVEKSKNRSHDEVETMLSLLDEEDLLDLRARVKARLLSRIDTADDGELSSLDALLAETHERKQQSS